MVVTRLCLSGWRGLRHRDGLELGLEGLAMDGLTTPMVEGISGEKEGLVDRIF